MTITMEVTASVKRTYPFEITVTDDAETPVATDMLLRVTNADGAIQPDFAFTTDVSGTTVIEVPSSGPRGANTFDLYLAPDTSVQATTSAQVLNA